MKKLLKKFSERFSIFNSQFSILQKGFTLIELLVVIAVIGVLAAIVLLAVNPGEQLARARDTNRVSAVTQIGRTLQAYSTANGAVYPAVAPGVAPCTLANDWMCTIFSSGDLKVKVGNVAYGSTTGLVNCSATKIQTVGPINGTSGWGYCYGTNGASDTATGTDAIVYVNLESTLNNNKCPGFRAWAVFATSLARAGIWCSSLGNPEPTVALVTTLQ